MKSDYSEYIDHLIKTKSYSDLSAEEKEYVDENIGGVKSYESLSRIVKGLQKEMEVSSSTKQSLVRMMKEKNKSVWSLAMSYKIPAYFFFIFLPIIIFLTVIVSPEKVRMVETQVEIPGKTIVDTVYLKQEPDTVFVERTVRIPVYITQNIEEENESVDEKKAEQPIKKSLADQEDLRKLLSQTK